MVSFITRHALTKISHQYITKPQSAHLLQTFQKSLFSTTPIQIQPPEKLNVEMAIGVQEAARLYVRHGVTSKNLNEIGNHAESDTFPLLERWQKMMETFLGVQVYGKNITME